MSANQSTIAEELAEFLRSNAPRYLSDVSGEPLEVHLETGGDRVLSSLYRFRIEAKASVHNILIKLPGTTDASHSSKRPRLITVPDKRRRAKLEYATLSAIDRNFGALKDPRFDSVHVFDFVERHSAIVMEYKKCTPLSKLLLKTNRIQNPFIGSRPLAVLTNAGAWLKAFHSVVPSFPESPLGNDTRAKFVQHIEAFGRYLSRSRARTTRTDGLFRDIVEASSAHLPESFPTAIGHGDFAPRNILVGSKGQVSVIDTKGLARTAIYEDIALFIAALRTSKVQALTRRAAYSASVLDRQEHAFLSGYFADEEAPRAVIALFTVQALLDKWCAQIEGVAATNGGVSRLGRFYASSSIEWLLERELERQLRSIRAGGQ